MPFLADFLWRGLRADDAPDSVFLAPWPEARVRDDALLEEVAEVRRVVELGRQARGDAGLKLRQPLRRLVVQGAGPARRHVEEIAEELRVKEVEFAPVEALEVRVKPNLPVLGPKLGKELGSVRAALEAGEFEQLESGGVRVNGQDLGADEVLVERRAREGWALAEDDGLTVAMTTELDDELRLEGRVYELIHPVNTLRKDAGLELTDRIQLTLPQADSDLLQHADWIKEEVLATELATDSVDEPQIAKVA
jgi:isoleucyl-tRNA synthetase